MLSTSKIKLFSMISSSTSLLLLFNSLTKKKIKICPLEETGKFNFYFIIFSFSIFTLGVCRQQKLFNIIFTLARRAQEIGNEIYENSIKMAGFGGIRF